MRLLLLTRFLMCMSVGDDPDLFAVLAVLFTKSFKFRGGSKTYTLDRTIASKLSF